jgi:hypothetical protein
MSQYGIFEKKSRNKDKAIEEIKKNPNVFRVFFLNLLPLLNLLEGFNTQIFFKTTSQKKPISRYFEVIKNTCFWIRNTG